MHLVSNIYLVVQIVPIANAAAVVLWSVTSDAIVAINNRTNARNQAILVVVVSKVQTRNGNLFTLLNIAD